MFSDTSEVAIAAVVYLKAVDASDQIQAGFVCGKSKVAPVHGHTIPRLELCAAQLAVELAEIATDELDMTAEDVRYYTDSKVVLGYLHNQQRRFYLYVSNRVARILRLSRPQQWSHVPTTENPADQGTRTLHSTHMGDSMWLQGPKFLTQPEDDQEDDLFLLINPEQDKEVRATVVACKTSVCNSLSLGEKCQRFSSWKNLVAAIACLQHVASSCHNEGMDTCRLWHIYDESFMI